MLDPTRRHFLMAGSSALTLSVMPEQFLPGVRAEDVHLPPGSVQFRSEIEPLVQLLERTDRSQVIDKVLAKIQDGTSYRELLAALFLAGIRNVQPRPAVGFKFHSVLVVHAAHQASVGAKDSQRWMPLLWGIDYFKRAQATDVSEGDWTMASVDESRLPEGGKALADFSSAMERWDVEAADAAAASAARVLSASQLLDVLAKYATRDFRSIGHKSIYVAGAFRLLSIIGWEHAEPVIRSLAYAALNHTGEPNPSTRDADADRSGKQNWELVRSVTKNWRNGRKDEAASVRLLDTLRSATPADASKFVVSLLGDGIHPSSIYDGMFLAASELVSKQPAIVPLHAATTTNAIHYLYQHVSDDDLRLWLLLQNASFLAHFREAANLRGELAKQRIDEWTAGDLAAIESSHSEKGSSTIDLIFEQVRKDRTAAAQTTLQYLQSGGSAEALIARSRELVFLKGNDSHDYKFSSAVLEDYHFIAPKWRNTYLAASTYLLRGESEATTDLAKKIIQQET